MIICNSGPLITLSKIGYLHLLPAIFGRIFIPEAVYNEVVENGAGLPGAEEVRNADFIRVLKVENQLAVNILLGHLDLGETEVIVLAKEKNAKAVLLDDRKARTYARGADIEVFGTMFVLYSGLRRGLIKDSYEELLTKLHRAGMRIADHIVARLYEQ
ncbi:Predicted nucleic acid-binding protein, contains PIN domain [Desulforamulus putei DSM 12395]|uniref:Predicted nucleic acid-binding protein, contains PIN domain n=1 Tax=Desulforamulus putei DSM 12395 TaxID=1121429 RepID=A0A1M4XD79_9FIRM|nr:hypothetical protein [Desulforamulus putei]SHE91391.1 Predicted nucleic acid-binding protein, contains PIN domain [Desulforamulus putei DSM 12395]